MPLYEIARGASDELTERPADVPCPVCRQPGSAVLDCHEDCLCASSRLQMPAPVYRTEWNAVPSVGPGQPRPGGMRIAETPEAEASHCALWGMESLLC
jgi:hypothetical protein